MAIDSVGTSEPAVPSQPAPPPHTSTYPMRVEYAMAERNQRFWAVPIVGIVAKLIILIPHFLVMTILGYAIGLAQLILWIPVLFTGRYPTWGYALVGGYLRWSTRLTAFYLGLTDEYPPFTFRSARDDDTPYLVQVRFEMAERQHRWWAIPLIGYAVRLIMLIPHVVILSLLWCMVGLLWVLATWEPALFGGRYPRWAYQPVGGTLRWSIRVAAFFYGLTDRYPPFSFD